MSFSENNAIDRALLERIDEGENVGRARVDLGRVESLAVDMVRRHALGVAPMREPLECVRAGDRFRLTSGHHRLLALRSLANTADDPALRAYATTPPVRVLPDLPEPDRLLDEIAANLQRSNPGSAATARAIHRLRDAHDRAGNPLSLAELAQRLDRSRADLTNLAHAWRDLTPLLRDAWLRGCVGQAEAVRIRRSTPEDQHAWLTKKLGAAAAFPLSLDSAADAIRIAQADRRRSAKPAKRPRKMSAAKLRELIEDRRIQVSQARAPALRSAVLELLDHVTNGGDRPAWLVRVDGK